VSTVVIVDNGGANVASVLAALRRLGVDAEHSADPSRVQAAERVILPGVGAAGEAMGRLSATGLDRLIPTLRQPVLGICLGMQLLYEASAEGEVRCLGVFRGVVARLLPAPGLPVPHMGWNRIEVREPSPLLAGVAAGSHAYFAHSYAAPVGPDAIASCEYGSAFSAIASRGNFHGTQFHPERSSTVGARLLANFLALSA
jgi:glutamine amidotransferase